MGKWTLELKRLYLELTYLTNTCRWNLKKFSNVFSKRKLLNFKFISINRCSLWSIWQHVTFFHVMAWQWWPSSLTHVCVITDAWPVQGPVSLRLMTSQFKDIVTHTQKKKTAKCIFFGVWVQNFLWNFKGALWNFTQNFEPIHRKICILRCVKNLTTYDILELWHLKS